MFAAVILTLALVLPQDPAGQATAGIVQPGYAGVGTLPPGTEARFTLKIDAPGAVTFSLESFEFDPVLSVADGQGRIIASDEDSGTGDGAWLSLAVKPFVTYEIVVGSQDEGGGHYDLAVHTGRADPPQETDAEGLARVYRIFAEDARAKGNPRSAGILYYQAGQTMFSRAEYLLAAPLLREALAVARESGNATVEVAATGFLGGCERRVGDIEESIALLETAWERREVIANPGFDCFLLENLGEAHFARHELGEALQRFDAWADIAAEAGLTSFEALAHARRGKTLDVGGDRVAAGRAYDRALALLDEFEDPYYESQVLVTVGQFLGAGDRYEEAAETLERAAKLETTWEVRLQIQLALGKVQTSLGRYGPAGQCLERSAALLADREDRRFEFPLQLAMAELAFRTGHIHDARELTERSIEIARGRDDTALLVQLLAFLGMLQEQSGELFAAGRIYEQAQGLCGGLDRPELEWRVLFDQGRLERKQKHYTKSLELQSRALDLTAAIEDPSYRAHCLNGIAYTLTFLGEHEQAREGAQAALAIWEQTGETDQALMGPLHTLAVVALAQGQLDEVDRLLARADEIIERGGVSGLRRMDAAGVRSSFVAWGEVSQDLVARRLQQPDADRAALVAQGYDRAGHWKARALLEGMPAADAPEDPAGTLRDKLGSDRVLIEYARGAQELYVYVLDARGLRMMDLGAAPHLDALVDGLLSGMTRLDALASADQIAERGSALCELMLAPVLATLDDEVDGLVIVPTASLARLPFEALVLGVHAERDAALGFDEIEFLADRYHVTYGPSSPVLARLATLGPRRTPGRALVMGDPWYASESPGATIDGGAVLAARGPHTIGTGTYNRLIATRAEVLDIAEALLLSEPQRDAQVRDDLAELAVLKRERSGELESRRFDLYLGTEASADRLERNLRQYDVLHIAAHGEVDPDDPLRTGLVFAYDGTVHGYVTLLDILDLQLDANLVVLSACETASGRILKGEGVQSMAQAFLQAGARAVVASLWSVDDSATHAIMSQFYESVLLGRRSGAEALRDAKTLRQLKQDVRHHGQVRGPAPGEPLRRPPTSNVGHPYYWAPFIYVGAIP